jgi:glyoxylase-like metal-dependent hydrolase (beta-lactamase superfamily II)
MSDARARVVVVREGFVVREGPEIKDASSSVTLVESAGQRLLIDTGSPRDCKALRTALEGMEVSVDSVKQLVNTHMHIDHVGCNHIFRSARTYAHALESPPIGTIKITDSLTVLPGVEVIHTPGHTFGSVTVLVEGEKRYAVCGDAIPTWENYQKHVPPFINVNPMLALKSMDAITSYADVIVPGHGAPFEVFRKK